MKYDKRALRRLMVERGLDERAMIQRSGLASRTIYYLTRGMTVPRADTLGRLALALDVSVEAFYVRKAAA